MTTPAEAAAELLRRRFARQTLAEFAQAIDVPGKPVPADGLENEWLFKPVETLTAAHQILLMNTLDRVLAGEIQNLMVFMPPGSAKSTYASVVFPAYAMGKLPGLKIILGSYASDIAWKQSRRTRQIVKSAKYTPLFGTTLAQGHQSVASWSLDNGSEQVHFYLSAVLPCRESGSTRRHAGRSSPVKGRNRRPHMGGMPLYFTWESQAVHRNRKTMCKLSSNMSSGAALWVKN